MQASRLAEEANAGEPLESADDRRASWMILGRFLGEIGEGRGLPADPPA